MAEESPITLEDKWFVGERKVFEFTVVNDGVPVNITSWELEWVLRQAASAPTPLITKADADITKSDPTNGVCRVIIEPADTLAIEIGAGDYYHTLKRVDGDNDAVLAFGEAVLRMAATR